MSKSRPETAQPTDDLGPSQIQPLPTVSQDDELILIEPASFGDFDFDFEFFNSSALANLEASLSEGVTMEEIIQQPVGDSEKKRPDSGYESYLAEDHQEYSGGSE